MKLSYYQKTDCGRVREINEDSFSAILPKEESMRLKEGSAFVVADGLGGLADGEIASRGAIYTFEELWRDSPNFRNAEGVNEIFNTINKKIFELNRPKNSGDWMATTLTASFFYEDLLYIGHVGDCRVYQVRHHKIHCLTKDHSSSRNILTRAIGTHPSVQVDFYTAPLQTGDCYVQCSDGLYSMADDEAMLNSITQNSPQQTCETLVTLANRQGGLDNITVQVIQLYE